MYLSEYRILSRVPPYLQSLARRHIPDKRRAAGCIDQQSGQEADSVQQGSAQHRPRIHTYSTAHIPSCAAGLHNHSKAPRRRTEQRHIAGAQLRIRNKRHVAILRASHCRPQLPSHSLQRPASRRAVLPVILAHCPCLWPPSRTSHTRPLPSRPAPPSSACSRRTHPPLKQAPREPGCMRIDERLQTWCDGLTHRAAWPASRGAGHMSWLRRRAL